jgi:hypothetical protein
VSPLPCWFFTKVLYVAYLPSPTYVLRAPPSTSSSLECLVNSNNLKTPQYVIFSGRLTHSPTWNTLILRSSRNVKDQVWHPHTTRRSITFNYARQNRTTQPGHCTKLIICVMELQKDIIFYAAATYVTWRARATFWALRKQLTCDRRITQWWNKWRINLLTPKDL